MRLDDSRHRSHSVAMDFEPDDGFRPALTTLDTGEVAMMVAIRRSCWMGRPGRAGGAPGAFGPSLGWRCGRSIGITLGDVYLSMCAGHGHRCGGRRSRLTLTLLGEASVVAAMVFGLVEGLVSPLEERLRWFDAVPSGRAGGEGLLVRGCRNRIAAIPAPG
jgi:hypothetical protein